MELTSHFRTKNKHFVQSCLSQKPLKWEQLFLLTLPIFFFSEQLSLTNGHGKLVFLVRLCINETTDEYALRFSC